MSELTQDQEEKIRAAFTAVDEMIAAMDDPNTVYVIIGRQINGAPSSTAFPCTTDTPEKFADEPEEYIRKGFVPVQ